MGTIRYIGENMEYFNIKISQKINNFFKRIKSKYYGLLAIIQNSKDRDLNSLIIAQIIVILMLVVLILIINIGHQLIG